MHMMYAEDVVFKFQKSLSIMKMISKLKDLIDLRPDMYIYIYMHVPVKAPHFCNI